MLGAGIFIVELYMGYPVVTLFGMNAMNYSDPGGKIDIGETALQAASRECREETENLINIQPHELLQYATPVTVNQYLAYILYVENISFQDYAHNVNIIYNTCHGARAWKETNSMARVPVNNMLTSVQNSLDYAYDVNGTVVRIRGRAMAIAKVASNILLNISTIRPIPLYRHQVTASRMACLIGTITYTMTPQAIYTPMLPNNIEYAIYIAPNLTHSSHSFLQNCNSSWGGMHVTIAGFHVNQPAPQKFIQHISQSGTHKWTITENTIKVKDKKIYFASKTLDNIAKFLHENGFHRVKYSNNKSKKWHITSECKIPSNIKSILKKQTWSIVLISKENGIIKWLDRYPLNI